MIKKNILNVYKWLFLYVLLFFCLACDRDTTASDKRHTTTASNKLSLSDIYLSEQDLFRQYFFKENFVSVEYVDSISKLWQSDPKNCKGTRILKNFHTLRREFSIGQHAKIAKRLFGKPDSIHISQKGETYIYITDCPPNTNFFNAAAFIEFRKNRIYLHYMSDAIY